MATPTVSMLGREVYAYAEVDRLIGLQSGTARRWINGYERAGKSYDPVLRVTSTDSAWVTWGEFVEARMLAEYRDIKKIGLARLRTTVVSLRHLYGIDYPLAHFKPYLSVHGRDLTIGGKEVGVPEDETVVRIGQRLLSDARWLADRAVLDHDDRGEPIMTELPADRDFPDIVINPTRYSGQPTFVGSRVSPVTIAGMANAGERPEDLAVGFGLSVQLVQDAIAYTGKYRLAA